jgi:uncharacterized protein HemX
MPDLGLKTKLVVNRPDSALDCIHELLQLHQRTTAEREELQEQLQRHESNARASDKAVQRLQHSLESKQRELEDLQLQVK